MIRITFLLFSLFVGSIAYAQNENLVTNGDFTQGNKLSSDLSYSYASVAPGEYTISHHAEFNNPAYVTPPNTEGRFLIADMSEEFKGKRIWYTTVKIDTGKTYLFSLKAANINKIFMNPSALRLTVNGKNIGRIFHLPSDSHEWIVCSAYYTNGKTLTEITVAVENMVFDSDGNDLALTGFSVGEAENKYLKFNRKDFLVPPKKDSVQAVIPPVQTFARVDTTIPILKEKTQEKDLQKDSFPKTESLSTTKPKATIVAKKTTTAISPKKETKKTETLKPGDGIRAPKKEYTWELPEKMSVPKKDPPASTKTITQKKVVHPPVEKKTTASTAPKKTVKTTIKTKTVLPIEKIVDSTKNENAFSKPPVVGEKLQLGQVYFEQGTAILTPSSFRELTNFVDYMNLYSTVRIRLEGHTDTQGDSAKNMLLSEHRVQYLKQYMVEKGIAADRIEWKGFGSSKPLNSNRIEGLRKLNRRVEVVLLSK